MGQERVGPRKPATKFPHLRKQLTKNSRPSGKTGKKQTDVRFSDQRFGQTLFKAGRSNTGDAAR